MKKQSNKTMIILLIGILCIIAICAIGAITNSTAKQPDDEAEIMNAGHSRAKYNVRIVRVKRCEYVVLTNYADDPKDLEHYAGCSNPEHTPK